MKIDYYQSDYVCEKEENCPLCFWCNGEKCIRQLLTEEDIAEIKYKKE